MSNCARRPPPMPPSSKTRFGVSPWLGLGSTRRRPLYPRVRGRVRTEVVIIGAGLTGCATAYAFAAARVPVVVVDAYRVGQGQTGRRLGVVPSHPDGDYRTVEARHGRRVARHVWRATRRAALDLATTLRRLRAPCQLETTDSVLFAGRPSDATLLRRELRARHDVGLEGTWLTDQRLRRLTDLEAAGAIRTRGHALVDPYRACLGLATAAVRRGSRFFERSRVTRIKPGRDGVEVCTESGIIQADRVVMTTGPETGLLRSLARHLRASQTYAVMTPRLPASIRSGLPGSDVVIGDTATPPHHLRWTADHRVLFRGADRPPPSSRRAEAVLVQRAGQLMYELSTLYPVISGIRPEYAWPTTVTTTVDQLPWVGPHRHYPRHLFGIGLGGHALTNAFLAARLLVRHHREQLEAGDELFGFNR